MQIKQTKSWGVIIIWCIFFFPVGLYFLYQKVNANRADTLNNGRKIAIISYIFIAMGIIAISGESASDPSNASVAVGFVIGGIVALFIARKMIKKGKKFDRYQGIIVNQGYTRIDDIAQAVNSTYSTVRADLQEMINSDYFVGAIINDGNREIVLAGPAKSFKPKEPQEPMYTVTCSSCGGKSMIVVGKTGKCDYCGCSIK